MKQNTFEIKQEAETLLKNAIAIWRQSNQSDQLEGIENDPVFSIMITALAYQFYDIDADIARFRQEVLDEYIQQTQPFELGHALPATAVIETNLQNNMPPVHINEGTKFLLGNTNYEFIPLLETTVFGASIDSLKRLDNRRWKMRIKFATPVTDISGLAFAIKETGFKKIQMTINGKKVPMIKPWQYSELPLCRCFGYDNVLYGNDHLADAASTWFDLFARQDIRLFVIKKHNPTLFINYDTNALDVTMEFSGTTEDFVIHKESIALNPVLLVNANPRYVNLSADTPIARVSGYNNREQGQEKFMHLTRPNGNQIYEKATVDVRTVAADRFNPGSLLKVINSLLNKLNTDYYAFLNIEAKYQQSTVKQLRNVLIRLQKAASQHEKKEQLTPGVYLMLRQNEIEANPNLSLQVTYLTTNGADVNETLSKKSYFALPAGLTSPNEQQQIVDPVPGFDPITDKEGIASLSRYSILTQDRIVTHADMKAFCYKELRTHYSIPSEMVKKITVKHHLQEQGANAGYEIWVDILVQETPFVTRYFTDKIPQAELFIEKMMETRSTTLYPIQVNIRTEA